MSSVKKSSISKVGNTSQKKPMEINMSCLSTAQKKMCIKLLAESNINFEQGKNGFQAQLKIDPNKLTSQFNIQKSQLDLSVIEAKSGNKNKNSSYKKSNMIKNKENNVPPNQNRVEIEKKKKIKRDIDKLYNNNKKPLCKVIKNNPFKQLQQLHPSVQLYIYPKKMTFQSLVQVIETFYDKYWIEVVQNNNKRAKNVRQKNKNITQSNLHIQPITFQSQSFTRWIYHHFISAYKDKIKLQQALVNLIQSLNHFSYKHPGIQLFCNFLQGSYNLQTLQYFLVIRSLLQQLYGQKILDKISNYSRKEGYILKVKTNPYQKLIEENKIFQFLDVCVVQEQNNQNLEKTQREQIFQQMTGYMFFDQRKRRNFIQFHDMACVLLESFTKKLKYIEKDNSFAHYDSEQNALQNYICKSKKLAQQLALQDDSLDLCYEVKQKGSDSLQFSKYQSNVPFEQQQNSVKYSSYLPKPKKAQNSYEQNFRIKVYQKFEHLCSQFLTNQDSQIIQNCSLILQTLLQAIIKGQKQEWLSFLRKTNHWDNCDQDFEEKELLFIQKLQQEYRKFKQIDIVHLDFVRKILTTHALRNQMINSLSF